MKISEHTFETMKNQIYLDCNVKEAYKIKDDIYIAPSLIIPGSRVIDKTDPFFRVIVFMGTAYIMADEETIPGWEEIFKDCNAEWFFNFGLLKKIDYILKEYDREIIDTHIYYLPDENYPRMNIPSEWKWLSIDEINANKNNNEFPHALCYSNTQPDVYAVAALDSNGNYKAMAGASDDGKFVRQIGIDVKPEFRGEGLATQLVSGLKQHIIDDGFLPFYGTSESHAYSRIVGIKSGFLPAFSELFVAKLPKKI